MKKVTLLITFLAITFTSFAQLNGIRKREATETIAVARFQTIKLNKSSNTYYLCITETGNRFDSPFLFSLGTNKEKSLSTLLQLISLCDELGIKESIVTNNPYNEFEVSIIKDNEYTGGVLVFMTTGVAGTPSIIKKELLKFRKALEKYVE